MNCLSSLVHTSLNPKIIWYQTDFSVTLRIMLQDVDKYYLKVEIDSLIFNTTVNGNNYCFCTQLFGSVIPSKTLHRNLGREIEIYLYKAHKWTEWTRLHLDQERHPNVVADLDRFYRNDWTKDPGPSISDIRIDIAEYKRITGIAHIMPDVPSSDEENSDDERIMATDY